MSLRRLAHLARGLRINPTAFDHFADAAVGIAIKAEGMAKEGARLKVLIKLPQAFESTKELSEIGLTLIEVRDSVDDITKAVYALADKFTTTFRGVSSQWIDSFLALRKPSQELSQAYDAALDAFVFFNEGKVSQEELMFALEDLATKMEVFEKAALETEEAILSSQKINFSSGTEYDNNPATILATPVAPSDMAEFVYGVADKIKGVVSVITNTTDPLESRRGVGLNQEKGICEPLFSEDPSLEPNATYSNTWEKAAGAVKANNNLSVQLESTGLKP